MIAGRARGGAGARGLGAGRPGAPWSRRAVMRAGVWAAAGAALGAGCHAARREQVTLYSSADDPVLRQVVSAFEGESDVRVRAVGDTEATKTFGLVERLLGERAHPRADVWWSSEPFGTIRLAREGIFEAYESPAARDVAGGWPAGLRGRSGLWYGFALRARVIAFDERRVTPDAPPRTLRELSGERWRGRVGMARPQFGTTRGHMAALCLTWGEPAFRAWLEAMHANGLRLYDGNAAVVRAIAHGEIDAGLTDTDDVWSARRERWPVGLAYESREVPGSAGAGPLPSPGPMLIPNTVARVAGGPNPGAARLLIDFLLSPRVERLLAASDSRHVPVRPEIRGEFRELVVPDPADLDLEAVADAVPRALLACEQVLRA